MEVSMKKWRFFLLFISIIFINTQHCHPAMFASSWDGWPEEKARLMEMWGVDQAALEQESSYAQTAKDSDLCDLMALRAIPRSKRIGCIDTLVNTQVAQYFREELCRYRGEKAVLFSVASYVGILSKRCYKEEEYKRDALNRQVPTYFWKAATQNPAMPFKVYLIDPNFAVDTDMPLGLRLTDGWTLVDKGPHQVRRYQRANVEVVVLPFYFCCKDERRSAFGAFSRMVRAGGAGDWEKFDSAIFDDYIGNVVGNNGVVLNTNGRIGGSYEFDTSSDHLNISTNSEL